MASAVPTVAVVLFVADVAKVKDQGEIPASHRRHGRSCLCLGCVDPVLMAQARRTGTNTDDGPAQLYEATPIVGESSVQAVHDAEAWFDAHRPDTTAA